MSGDIKKITRVSTTAQENIGMLIENAIPQALTKPQDIIPLNPARDLRSFEANQ